MQKLWQINRRLLVVFPSIFMVVSCASSNNTPKNIVITICISDPANNGLQCSTKEGITSFIEYPKTEDYLCVSPEDAPLLF